MISFTSYSYIQATLNRVGGLVNDLECCRNRSVILHINRTLQICVSYCQDADCRSIEMQKGKMLYSAMMTEQAQSIKDFFYRKRFRSSGLRQSWSSSKCTRRTRLKLSHFDWTSLVNSRLIIKQYDFTLIRIKSGFFFFECWER